MSVVLILSSYLLGSIPSAYIAGRLLKGIDIRNFGDGNVGAGNAYRVVRPAAGVAVFIADASKGVVAVLVTQALASQTVALLAGAIQFAPLWLVALLMGAPRILVIYGILLPCLLVLRYLQTARRRRMMLARSPAIVDEDGRQEA